MQDKFKFVYDVDNHPCDLDMVLHGIDREAVDIYNDQKYKLHRTYKNNVPIGGIVRARQQKPRSVHTIDQWPKTCDLFESETYKVSEIFISQSVIFISC